MTFTSKKTSRKSLARVSMLAAACMFLMAAAPAQAASSSGSKSGHTVVKTYSANGVTHTVKTVVQSGTKKASGTRPAQRNRAR
jgi:hypothetical protein